MLCLSSEVGETVRPLPDNLTEQEAREIVLQVASFMRLMIYDRPWSDALLLSVRAQNALRRHEVRTVGEVAQMVLGVTRPGQIRGLGYLCLREIKDQLMRLTQAG